MRSLGPALVLGNAVVLKSDPNTPVSGGVIIARIFEEAGLPSGVLHVLCGGPEVGQALVEDPNVRMISFTGSTKTGRLVGEAAGRGLKRVVLELGGNSPLIVLEDADIDGASSAGAWGSFLHQGQICLAVSRHLVHESIAEEYLAALTERAAPPARRQPGDGRGGARPDHQREADRARAADRRRDGRGGRHGARRRLPRRPVLPADRARATSRPEMAAFKEEIFGPVAAGHDVQHRRRGRRARERDGVRACRRRSSPAARSGPTPSPRASTRAWSTSTTRRSTRSRRRRSEASSARATAATSAAWPARALDRVAVADVEGEGRAVPVLA